MKFSRMGVVILAAFTLLVPSLMAGDHLVNVDKNGVALQGYDPVAFFTDGKPVKGNPDISFAYEGATYHFSTEANKEAFAKDPEKYEPLFGGYCAYGVAQGGLYSISVDAFNIYEGKLLLQKNKSVRDLFNEDAEGNFKKAVGNWPDLEKKHNN